MSWVYELLMILMADLSFHAFIAIAKAAVLANRELVDEDRQPLKIQILVEEGAHLFFVALGKDISRNPLLPSRP